MPGQLGLMPILPPSRKNVPGIKGVSGGVNAAPKAPRFPMPLDHPSSGLGHISGGVNAGGGAPLTGISGHVSAPSAPKAPHSPISIRGVSGGVSAPPRESAGQRAALNFKGVIGKLRQSENEVGKLNLTSGRAFQQGLLKSDREQRLSEQHQFHPKNTSGPGGLMGVALFPEKVASIIGSKEIAGAETLLGKSAGKALGGLTSEAVNLPTQLFPASYAAGAGIHNLAFHGNPHDLESLGHQYLQNSALAQLFKGNFSKAADLAGKHPLGTGLEASGAVSGVDSLAGALRDIGKMSPADAGALADKGAVSAPPRELPPEAVPKGGAGIPQRPFHKGLVRQALERASRAKPVSKQAAAKFLKANVDQHEAEQVGITRGTRAKILDFHRKVIHPYRTTTIPGQTAVRLHSLGILGDPAKLEDGLPIGRRQLAEFTQHLSQKPPGEFAEDKAVREEVLKELQKLQGSQKYEANPKAAYDANQKIADEKKALEPELQEHRILDKETARANKMKVAFRFHMRNEGAHVEPSVPKGESPFYLGGPPREDAGGKHIGGIQIPMDEVARRLEAEQGVHENQLSFASTAPHQNAAKAFRSGRTLGGRQDWKGHLTGDAVMRGQFDPSPDSLLRQHLTNALSIDHARGHLKEMGDWFHTRKSIVNVIRKNWGDASSGEKQALRGYFKQILAGKPGKSPVSELGAYQHDLYFPTRADAIAAQKHLKGVDVDLRPMRVAHPFATRDYREGLARTHMDMADEADRLDPNKLEHEGMVESRFPTKGQQLDPTAGPWTLVHPSVANRLAEYEGRLGKAHVAELPGNFWRRMNVAYSVRHYPGVMQEMAIRLLANNIGLLSGLRGRHSMQYLEEFAKQSDDQAVKLGWNRIKAMTGGSWASYAGSQSRHIPLSQLQGTMLEKPADWWLKGESQKITGIPLKAIRGAVTHTSHVTDWLLNETRKYIEHPPQTAGLGKHFDAELKTMYGKRLPVLKAFSDVEKEFLQGRLNPKAVDHFLNVNREYWGDWMRSSPRFRQVQAIVPFARWYVNALRFIYATLPVHHPGATGLLVAIETATEQEREAEGQGYKPILSLGEGQLMPYQQGSIPLGKGERGGLEYYSPQGAVSQGLTETITGAVFPYMQGIKASLEGVDPLTHKPLEEEVEGSKVPIRDQGKLAFKAAESVLESFLPPARIAKTMTENVEPEKQLNLPKRLGIPPGVGKALVPIREEKAHYVGGKGALPPGLLKGGIGKETALGKERALGKEQGIGKEKALR